MGIAALTGCELVSGIQDLTYSGTGAADAASGNDATLGQEDSGSDSAIPEAGGDQSAVLLPDGYGAGSSGDGSGDVLPVAVEAAGDASPETADVASPPSSDASDGGGTTGAMDGVAPGADAGPVSWVVPIPGPDGLLASDAGDGGPLLGELIDDIDSETTPGWIPIRSGRVGTWFTYADATPGGVVPPAMSPPAMSVGMIPGWDGNASNLAAHVSGNGLATYAGMGFDLNAYNLVASTYDASAYRGFVFWARSGAETGTTSVKFAVPDINTDAAGGVCSAASDGGAVGCSDYFAKTVTVTPTWREFVVYFSQLGQAGFGLPKGLTGLDVSHIYSCQFQFSPGAAFDVWIDDVYFIVK